MAAFRRSVFRQFEDADTSQLAIDYLYVDSDSRDIETAANTTPLDPADRMWRVLGRSVQLAPAQTFLLTPGNLDHIIQNVSEYPRLKRWIGPSAVWDEIRAGNPNGITAAGQLRRFGRLLLAQNIDNLRSALTARLAQPRGVAVDGAWTFHVVAGLAGGTGSGTVLDIVSLIRELPQGSRAKVVMYCVLPEGQETDWAKHNYYANGYAALKELNGLIVGQHRLSNIAETAGRYEHEKFVDNVFVVTNENSDGVLIDMGEMVPNLVAEAMYQIVVASGDARPLGGNNQAVVGAEARVWRSMVTGENYSGQYEADPGEGPTRANRFLGFGIKRIAIPTEEIHDYAAGVLVRQFLLQSTRMNWVEGEGYIETDRAFDAAKAARDPANQSNWKLTLPHLRLEDAMLSDDGPGWAAIRSTIVTAFNRRRDDLVKEEKHTEWISKVQDFADKYYRDSFRVVGVEEFYRVRERSIPDRAKFIVRDRVGASLFDSWKNGERSLREIVKVLDELIIDTAEKRQQCEKLSGLAQTNEKNAEARRKESVATYNAIGVAGGLLGQRQKTLNNHVEILADIYANRGARIANEFARVLLSKVLTELADLRETAQLLVGYLDQALERTNRSLRERVRVDGSGAADSSQTTKLYDALHIRGVMARVQQDMTTQQGFTAAVREAIIGKLGASKSFGGMKEKLNAGQILAISEELAQVRADVILSEQEATRDRILETSIIQKLYDDYDGRDAELRALIGNEVRRASSFAPHDTNQRMIQTGADIETVKVAFVPSRDDLPEGLHKFHTDLCQIIRNAAAGENVEIVQTSNNHQEIVFLSLANQFALRHLSGLSYLKTRYKRLLTKADGTPTDDAARKRLELHLEGDGTDLPELYAISPADLRRQVVGHYHIARLAGLLREVENPRSGQMEVILLATDELGAVQRLKIGGSLEERVANLDIETGMALRKAVDRHLATLEMKRDREELLRQATSFYNEAMEKFDHDPERPGAALVIAEYQAVRNLLTR